MPRILTWALFTRFYDSKEKDQLFKVYLHVFTIPQKKINRLKSVENDL